MSIEHTHSLLKKKHELATYLTHNHQTHYRELHCFSGVQDLGHCFLQESKYPIPLADSIEKCLGRQLQ